MTQENVENRIAMHNTSGYGNHYTSQTDDWTLFVVINCVSLSQAMKIENTSSR
ncbi:GIY-YIG nuclease family protein [Flavobacterium agrisoli]